MALETTVDFIHGEDTIIWSTNHFATIRKMEELIEKYPNDVQIVRDCRNADGEAKLFEIRVPAKWMRMPRPPKKREFTEEQRQAASERFRKYHAERKKMEMEDAEDVGENDDED